MRERLRKIPRAVKDRAGVFIRGTLLTATVFAGGLLAGEPTPIAKADSSHSGNQWILPTDNMKYYPPIVGGFGIHGSGSWVDYTNMDFAKRDAKFMKDTGMKVVTALTVGSSVLSYVRFMHSQGNDVMVRFYSDKPEEMSQDDLNLIPELSKVGVKRAQAKDKEPNVNVNRKPGESETETINRIAKTWVNELPYFQAAYISLATPSLAPGGDIPDEVFLRGFMGYLANNNCAFGNVVTLCIAAFDGRYGTPASLGVHPYSGTVDRVLPDGTVQFAEGNTNGFHMSKRLDAVMREYIAGPYETIATEGGADRGPSHKALTLAIRREIFSGQAPVKIITQWIAAPNNDPEKRWGNNAWEDVDGTPLAVDTINALEATTQKPFALLSNLTLG